MPSSTAKYAAPETRGGGSSGSTKLGAADMWSLGCLIWEVYNGELQRPEALKKVQSIPKKLLEPFVKLISANPRSRPSPTKFLKEARTKGKYLQNSFVDSNLFLDELAIKEPEAKSKFYKDLPASIDRYVLQGTHTGLASCRFTSGTVNSLPISVSCSRESGCCLVFFDFR